jgi:hypothetical protein
MTDTFFEDVTHVTSPTGSERIPLTVDPTGTPSDGYMTPDDLSSYIGSSSPSVGQISNGKISVTVASNDLTVAIKTLADADPSAGDPVLANINGTIHTITAALSVTAAAGTNWAGRGGAMFAALEQDWFAYLGYNATDGVVIGFSPISYAGIYSDFSTTSTDDTFCKISDITTAASSDPYINIGRFAATLSAGAGYTWTVPTFTNTNLKQSPIFETRKLTFLPTWTNLTLGNGTQTALHQIKGRNEKFNIHLVWGSTTSIGGIVTAAYPMTPSQVNGANYTAIGAVAMVDTGTALYMGETILQEGAGYIDIRVIQADATYAKWSSISSTVPHTWTTSDVLDVNGEYFI